VAQPRSRRRSVSGKARRATTGLPNSYTYLAASPVLSYAEGSTNHAAR
jgi:hypothetical protein